MVKINWHKTLYGIGLYNIGYKNKFFTPFWRVVECFAQIVDGILGLILFFTPLVPNYTQKVLRKIIKQQCKKYKS
jgi:hypothetical protein